MPDTIVAPPAAPAPDTATVLKDARFDPGLVMEETIKSSLNFQSEKEAKQEAIEKAAGMPPRDPTTGKFMPKDAQVAVQQDAAAAGQPAPDAAAVAAPPAPKEGVAPDEPAAEEVQIPEGYAAPPTLPPDRAGGFKVRDKEGELEPPDLQWEITTSGGPRTVSTEGMVALARHGFYNHQLQEQHQTMLQQLQAARTEQDDLKTYAQRLEDRFLKVMSSDEAYIAARADWDRQNTPEALLEREREARVAAEEQATLAQVTAQGQQYYATVLEPRLKQIAQALPTVSEDEIGMRLLLVTEHLRVRTPVGNIYPTHVYQQVVQALLDDVVPWAQQLAQHRQSSAPQPSREADERAKKATQEAEAARIRAQKARRVASAATKPLGGQAAQSNGQNARPQPGKTLAHKDAEAAVIGTTLASMRGQ
jgi:hypothetical protein